MAIFYVNYETGSDTTTTQKTATASNPSGTITRITITSHGYSNGDKVLLGQFSSWLNGIWTITNVATNTFDLQGAVWQTTADPNGVSIKMVNGDTWATSAKSVNRILANYNPNMQSTDEIRIAKTAEPTSIGNATWTSRTITVTLASAQTTLIDDCDSGWVAGAGGDVTVTTNTTRKSGTNRTVLTFDASPQINIKQAYKTLPAQLDLSSYDSICFWYWASAYYTNNDRLKICLCSDTTGDVIVDEFYIPAITSGSSSVPFSLDLTRNGGGALGNNINSIAVYTRGTAVTASSNYSLDNINACNASGLNINTLIGKSSTAWNTDPNKLWYPIKSINGTTITLDQYSDNTQTAFGNQLRGYYTTGTTPETVTTYILKPYQPPMDRTASESSSTSYVDLFGYNTLGTSTQQFIIGGGWNTTNDTQDGITFVNGRSNGNSVVWCPRDYTTWRRMGGMRFTYSTYSFYQNSGNSVSRKAYEMYGVANYYGAISIGFNVPTQGYTIEDIICVANNRANYIRFLEWNDTYPNSIKNWTIVSNEAPIERLGGLSAVPFENIKIYNNGLISSQARFCFSENNYSSYIVDINWKDFDIRHNATVIFAVCLSGDSSTIYGVFPRKFTNLIANNNSGNLFDNSSSSSSNPVTIYPPYITFVNADLQNNGSQPTPIYANQRFYDSNNTATVKAPYSDKLLKLYASYDRFNSVENDNRVYWYLANSIMQNTTTYSGSGYAWQLSITGSVYNSTVPHYYKISTIAFNANSLVTYKVWVKKTHATAIATRIELEGGVVAGVANSVTATKANDTNWEELTITFTPTKKGVADIYLRTWVTASPYTNSVYIDNVTVTQA